MCYLRQNQKEMGGNMSAKKAKKMIDNYYVVFVEGDADELIIKRLISYYKSKGWMCHGELKIKNTHGTPCMRSIKMGLTGYQQSKENAICFKAVICEYDTDIFEKGLQEIPDWVSIKNDIKKKFNVKNFCCIEAKTSIEDWILDDLSGLLKSLGLTKGTKPKGDYGQDKVKDLFKRKNMVYDRNKGAHTIKPIIDRLDIEKIRDARISELEKFEKILGIKIS